LTRGTSCEQGRGHVAPPFPISSYHVLKRGHEIAWNTDGVNVVQQRNLQATWIQFRHNVEHKASLGETYIASAAVAKQAYCSKLRHFRSSHWGSSLLARS
jgi:hypothetical protein